MYVVLFSLISALALVFYSVLLFLTWRRGFERTVTRWFAFYLTSMMIWSLGALMMYVNRSNVAAWNKVMVSGTALMPLAFFGFVQSFLTSRRHAAWVQAGAAYAVFLVILTGLGYLAGDISVTASGLIEFSLGPATPLFGLYYFLFLGLSAYDLAARAQDDAGLCGPQPSQVREPGAGRDRPRQPHQCVARLEPISP